MPNLNPTECPRVCPRGRVLAAQLILHQMPVLPPRQRREDAWLRVVSHAQTGTFGV